MAEPGVGSMGTVAVVNSSTLCKSRRRFKIPKKNKSHESQCPSVFTERCQPVGLHLADRKPVSGLAWTREPGGVGQQPQKTHRTYFNFRLPNCLFPS